MLAKLFAVVVATAGLTAAKAIVGVLTGSLAILSEAAHSLIDFGATVMTYFAVRISGKPSGDGPVKIIASSVADEVGQAADNVTQSVFNRGATFYGRDKEKDTVSVTVPLRDRNGDVVAAARIEMKSFLGQTDESILARAMPVKNDMQAKVLTAKDLYE